MCKEKHDTWIVSQIRELSETFELVMSAVKDKPEPNGLGQQAKNK